MTLRSLAPAALCAAAALAGVGRTARAELKVAAPVGDHMVVQQGRPVRLWGTAQPGEAVRAALGASSGAARADAAGRWRIDLPPVAAGGPYMLTLAGSSTLTFSDVWSGEVWLAAGQSNMELPLWRSQGADEAIAAGCPGLRLFLVAHASTATPGTDVEGRWQVCNAETAAAFSAVAFHFGRDVHRALGVPVGLIQAAWGGTPAEAWTPREALLAQPPLRELVDALDTATKDPAVREDYARKLAAWEDKSFHKDTGNRGEALGWARSGRLEPGWAKMDLPRLWESAGLPIDGAVWFRREVVVPPSWSGRDLALTLGALDDFDVSYWNGQRVGATGAETPQYYSVQRRYVVPGRLVHAGRNAIAVRVFDHYGSGGFAGPPSALAVAPAAGAETPIPLTGTWAYRIERKLPPAVADFNARPKLPGPDEPTSATVLWNGMVAPLAGLPIAGVIWYQGESNVAHAQQYRTLFPTMIRAWRAAWGDPALPFLFVQLPNYAEPGPPRPAGSSSWADLREAQAGALRLPRTAMAVTLDIGEGGDLHPRNKQEVGRRLALQALALAYHRDVITAGPRFEAAARDGAALRVRFAAAGGGLVTADGAAPKGFLLAGADHVWHPAEARIDGASVVVSSPGVPEPVAVRYGWADDPPNTLRNQADLPAAPFRSDDWPDTSATAAGP